MNISPIQLILPALGLVAFGALSSPSFAQEEKGTESTQGAEVGEHEVKGEDVVQKEEPKEEPKADPKKSDHKGKTIRKTATPEERECLKAVSNELGEYRTRKARLRQAHDVAKKNGNEEQLARVEKLRPKVENSHKEAMAALEAKYGKAQVDKAVQFCEAKSKGDHRSSNRLRKGGKNKGGDHSDKGKNKGKKAKKRGGNGSSDS